MSSVLERKVLVLHGFTQSSATIQKKLVNYLPKEGFVYTIPDGHISLDNEGHHAWFMLTAEQLQQDQVIVVQKDVDDLFEYAKQNFGGVYDVVIGYSQGCLAAELLIQSGIVSCDKALFLSPIPLPKDGILLTQSTTPRNIKTRIYVGAGDAWVPGQHTSFLDHQRQLLSATPQLLDILTHPKGHNIPVNKTYRDQYRDFLSQ